MGIRGFVATKAWPIVDEQKWTFVPQGNFTYAIVNGKNNMRVLAQNGVDGDRGFFAIDSGPIYEDQKWRLELQADGSYVITNVRSGRRILAKNAVDGGDGFVAVRSDKPAREEERWWFINQEKDESGKYLLQFEAAQTKNAKLGDAFKTKVGDVLSLKSELKSTQKKFDNELADSQNEATQLTQRILVQTHVNRRLSEQVVKKQNETERIRSDLQVVKDAKAHLAGEIDAARGKLHALSLKMEVERVANQNETDHIRTDLQMEKESKAQLTGEMDTANGKIHALSVQMEVDRSAKAFLMQEVEARTGVFGCLMHFPTDDPFLHTCKLIGLAVAVVLASIFLPCLMYGKATMRGKASMLATELGTVRAANGHLREENEEKHARIAELEQNLQCLDYPDADPDADLDGELGYDFAFQVFNTNIDQTTMRLIKIQCPGVSHQDIEVQLAFNGCEITVNRKASRGVEATTWKKEFQFKPSDGLFEFKEDQMQLEHGFLYLVFKAYTFQSRVIRFPMHFNLDADDNDLEWEYASDDEANEVVPGSPRKIRKSVGSQWLDGSYIDTASTASTPQRHDTASHQSLET